MPPAKYVVHMFGGVRATARAIGRNPGTVSRWSKPRDQKGCDGNVPGTAYLDILAAAKREGHDITASDLVHGRKVQKSKRG